MTQSYADAVPELDRAKGSVFSCPRCESVFDKGGDCPACRREWEDTETPAPSDADLTAQYEAHLTELAEKHLLAIPYVEGLQVWTEYDPHRVCVCGATVGWGRHGIHVHAIVCQSLRKAASDAELQRNSQCQHTNGTVLMCVHGCPTPVDADTSLCAECKEPVATERCCADCLETMPEGK